MTRRTADLFRAEDRIVDLEARNQLLAGLVAKLAEAIAVSAGTDDPGLIVLDDVESRTVGWPDDAALLSISVTTTADAVLFRTSASPPKENP